MECVPRLNSARFFFLVLSGVFFLGPHAHADDADKNNSPPTQIITYDQSHAVSTKLDGPDNAVEHQSADTYALSFTQRWRIRQTSWYYTGGLKAESFSFHNQGDFPVDRFQDVAGEFSIAYFIKADEAAHLKIFPGFYFQNHMNQSALDIPVELYTGVPITNNFYGAIGFSSGRFYHHPLPIIGFVWIASPKVQLYAVYPEPALIVTLSKKWEARLAGQLLGGGFHTDPGSSISRVNYYSYHAGAILKYTPTPGFTVSGGAGYETSRVFDAYRDNRQWETNGAPYAQVGVSFSR